MTRFMVDLIFIGLGLVDDTWPMIRSKGVTWQRGSTQVAVDMAMRWLRRGTGGVVVHWARGLAGGSGHSRGIREAK